MNGADRLLHLLFEQDELSKIRDIFSGDAYPLCARLNCAFLLGLGDDERGRQARRFIEQAVDDEVARFYLHGLKLIEEELRRLPKRQFADTPPTTLDDEGADEERRIVRLYRLLFPEGVAPMRREDRARQIAELRSRRQVTIIAPTPHPIEHPEREMLFTSNLLIGLPLVDDLESSNLDDSLRRAIEPFFSKQQSWWYDHPIPIGVATQSNEAIYGLRGLDEMMDWEIRHGTIAADAKLSCLLSISTTHEGLGLVAKRWLQGELQRHLDLRHLDVWLFAENDTRRILDEVLLPDAAGSLTDEEIEGLRHVFGVDGKYGRHFSFLKAIAALWHVVVNQEVRGTFKIDLDQIFPQDRLVADSGASALEHFRTPLWGARARDWQRQEIDLGMIAGALVNQKDIKRGLFTPDVPFPEEPIDGERLVFNSRLPQALSTEAEMMTRYDPRGEGSLAAQRVHVTGGTSGILIDALRRHRPFTPTFVGRAEDQAYLLSVLFSEKPPLRYLHQSGLIMRHDKQAIAGAAIKSASASTNIGDWERVLLFSHYAQALPWPVAEIKRQIDPFTGCFVSNTPATVVWLRYALAGLSLHLEGRFAEAETLQRSASRRIFDTLELIREDGLKTQFERERHAWDIYYRLLDRIDDEADSPVARRARDAMQHLASDCRIS